MTHAMKPAPHRMALPAAGLAILLLAGCSTGHIGDSWQCPLAEGGLCDSVAAADPAVPDPDAAGTTVLAEPLWRMRGAGSAITAGMPPAREPAPDAIRGPGQACAAECDGGFDPFAWLARLFAGAGSANLGGSGKTVAGTADPATGNASNLGDAAPEAETPGSPTAPMKEESRAWEPATARLPAGGDGAADSADADRHMDDLRTGEVVARIWIAPFVDADGVYREASHVRVVLEPAGWRLK